MKNLIRMMATGLAGVTAAMLVVGGVAFAQEQTLRVAMDTDPYPPFSFDGPNGKFSGFEVDLLDAYCAEMKVKCEIERIAWDGIIPALQAKKVDMIFNSMSITEERKKAIDFSNSYYYPTAVFVAAKTADYAMTPEGLQGKIVGAKAGTIYANYVEQRLVPAGVEAKIYQNQDEVNSELANGRIDVGIDLAMTMENFLKTPGAAELAVKGALPADPLLGGGVGAGVRKGDTELVAKINGAIDALAKNGQYKQIMQKYFAVDISPRP
jgi:polar amino acid transport system substrate-binding protein